MVLVYVCFLFVDLVLWLTLLVLLLGCFVIGRFLINCGLGGLAMFIVD